MKCPYCSYKEDKVIDSRTSKDAQAIRRRRECLKCARRFTTYEQIEEILPVVVKKIIAENHLIVIKYSVVLELLVKNDLLVWMQ